MKKFSLSLAIITAVAALVLATACKKKPATEEAGVSTAATMDSEAEKGKDLFTKNACSSCHGDTGKGDGPAGQALTPKPRNYRHLSEYKQGTSQAEIAATILKGIPGTSMPPNPALSEADRMAIAKYVVYLQTQP